MNEAFLYYVWQFQYFDKRDLRTTEGEKIEIFEAGFLNSNAGPDFLQARVRIGNISWAGSIEIHTKSSDWLQHQHQLDGAYENVILHVVWINDQQITRADSTPVPALELKSRIADSLIRDYKKLVHNPFLIPCTRYIAKVDPVVIISMQDKALAQRLENKAMEVTTLLRKNSNSWEETTWQLLARNFGMKVNGDAFFQLASVLPYKILLKHADKPVQLEALLFGQAGLLDVPVGDEYYLLLQREYRLLAKKYSIFDRRLLKAQWKFLRLRPANFPTVRLAQLSALMQHPHIFSTLLEAVNYHDLKRIIAAIPTAYWEQHYRFNKKSKTPVPAMGTAGFENVLINSVVPLLVAYAKLNDDQQYMDRAVSLLQNIAAENNKIIRSWKQIGCTARNAFETQALIELYNSFCQKRNCLTCAIGASLLKPGMSQKRDDRST